VTHQDNLRQLLRHRIAAGGYWIVALTEAGWSLTAPLLGAIEAEADPSRPPIDVYCVELELHGRDDNTDTEVCYGTLRLLSWSCAALSPESLQAVLARAGACPCDLESILTCPIVVPAPRSQLWHLGEQLRALTSWLFAEEVDEA
jgi:hypothetical protein